MREVRPKIRLRLFLVQLLSPLSRGRLRSSLGRLHMRACAHLFEMVDDIPELRRRAVLCRVLTQPVLPLEEGEVRSFMAALVRSTSISRDLLDALLDYPPRLAPQVLEYLTRSEGQADVREFLIEQGWAKSPSDADAWLRTGAMLVPRQIREPFLGDLLEDRADLRAAGRPRLWVEIVTITQFLHALACQPRVLLGSLIGWIARSLEP